ncbi:MAG: O-antigen ligase family protein [Gammaproteobacteria bacterium]|nr:O-antigen ligase family protein [Gammaproteobacteria bacterium]
MKRLIMLFIFFIVLFSFLANPAPVSIELYDFVLIGLTLSLGLLALFITTSYSVNQTESQLLFALILYLSYLLASTLCGFLQGVPFLNILRSIGPYINFFPLILLGFIPNRFIKPSSLGMIFIVVGCLQGAYLFYLYLMHAVNANSINAVLQSRITFMDQRTTLPLLLGVAILPLYYVLNKKNNLQQHLLLSSIALIIVLFGFIAIAMTLTRSIFLAVLFGWLTFIIFYLYQQSKSKSFSMHPFLIKLLSTLMLFILLFALLSLFSKVRMLESGLYARFFDHGANGQTDYSNGRIYDEWLPALNRWMNAGPISWLFGIGAGNSFMTPTGEERTYIHNLCLYSLVYGGLFGLISCLFLYFTLIKSLLLRAHQTNNAIYIAFLALLCSLFFYGQFFAVHKGLAFNVMLFLMIALALRKPFLPSNEA